jgi:hypothetical protein
VEVHETSWGLSQEQLPQAISWLSEQQPAPLPSTGPPFVIGVETRFRLKDPRSGAVLPFQGPEHYGHQEYGHQLPFGVSVLYARLSVKSTCSLLLCLPFGEVSDELQQYVATLQQRLPFKLSAKHWSRWQLNAAQTRYYSRKVSVV